MFNLVSRFGKLLTMKLFELKSLNKFSSKGFTLIELLIVIAILGVLAAGILVAIDPVDKISQANDAKVQNDISGAGRAAEAYATTHNGFYPAALADLTTSGELKRTPAAPTGYTAYSVVNTPAGCTTGTTCTGILISGSLKSKRFIGTTFWNYDSASGKSCAGALATTTCP